MMKKIFLTIASVALMSNSNVWALAGGPFDNGDPGGLLMERGGFYQCQFSFKNGNGYGIFTPDSYVAGNLPNANQTGTSSSQQLGVFNRGTLYTPNSGATALGHNANRSVFYYKGVTYVGGCFGFTDIDAREIQGSCNASSNEQITQGTLAQSGGGAFGGGSQGLAVTSQSVVINTAGFVLNAGWTGKITSTRPILRFRGKGELTVVSPSGASTLSALAFEKFGNLMDAIVQSVAGSGGQVGFNPATYTEAANAISDLLANLDANFLAAGGADALYEDANKEPLRVTGNRRFF